jgi:hypothetical protein
MPNIIYTSEKVLPYVYKAVHKETNEFYIGYRGGKGLKIPSHLDILKYRSSSKLVKPRAHEFNWIILAEFFNAIDAFEFEQSLIEENWNNPKILNKCIACKKFTKTNIAHSDESKSKISKAQKEHWKNMSEEQFTAIFEKRAKAWDEKTQEEKATFGKRKSDIWKRKTPEEMEDFSKKMSECVKGRYKGKVHAKIICPHCKLEGGKPSMKRWHFDNCKFKPIDVGI